jgi:hypothetical protein
LAIFYLMPAHPARAIRFADSLLALVAVAACALFTLSGCADSYCGAPCETRQAPASASEAHVNQYGSLYGYLEVDSLGKDQLDLEKNSLEFLIKANPRDAEILKALKAEGDSAYAFRYDDYSAGGDRFDASGKLRTPGRTEAGERRIARLISESQSRELFERYRRVRWRLIQRDRTEALAPSPASDTAWTGAYRAGSDPSIAAPGIFPSADSCAAWGERVAEAHRNKAFAFEYECRQGTTVVKRKVW